MRKEIPFDIYEKEFYSKFNVECLVAFQCEACGKVFRFKNEPLFFEIPLKFPTLTFSTPGNYNSIEFNYNFCSLHCLFELLKTVLFGFEVFTPLYFNDMNNRNDRFNRDWEEVTL